MLRKTTLQFFYTLTMIVLLVFILSIQKVAGSGQRLLQEPSVEGRWDITIQLENGREEPSWLEIVHSGTHHLVGQFVASGGSARPVAKINLVGNKISFTIPPQWEREDNDLLFEAIFRGDSLTGTMQAANGAIYPWVGKRAPLLERTNEAVWGTPIQLFNGQNLEGWHADGKNQWVVEDGILKSPRPGSNLITDQVFNDFKLHIEFKYGKHGNSGVYLRGRYEVQVEDSKGKRPMKDLFSAIYGFIEPTEMVAKEPGEWQSFDITLTGRKVTVVANGVTVICNREIPGITGGAINSREEEPGPIYLQGDHGPVEYRNIILTPAK